MTASPVVVGDTVYAGSWDGTFWAVDTKTGKKRWTFTITTAVPTAFGRIVSTASVVPFPDPAAPGGSRLVAVFGGGSSLWAVDAKSGKELAHIDLDPRDAATRAAEAADPPVVEVESSPVVGNVRVGSGTERRIFVGFDVHNNDKVGRTGLVALRLDTPAQPGSAWQLQPIWKLDPETGTVHHGVAGLTEESGQGFGCGGVWSSPALDVVNNHVVFGTASCSHPEEAIEAGENFAEQMIAARADTGEVAWSFRPGKDADDANLDDDFGASPNVFTTQGGRTLVGEGRKDACYYARDAKTGQGVWRTCVGTAGNISDGFGIGGFLGTTAVQTDARGRALRIIGASAIPIPHSLAEARHATIVVRAMDPANGALLWTYRLTGPTYASVSVAGGVVFVPDTFTSSLVMLDAERGLLRAILPVAGPPSSTAAVVGDSVYVTTGTRETDLEYKAFDSRLEKVLAGPTGASPLSPASGIHRFALPALPGLPG
jgi:outer membrane protein assembly factor BamB